MKSVNFLDSRNLLIIITTLEFTKNIGDVCAQSLAINTTKPFTFLIEVVVSSSMRSIIPGKPCPRKIDDFEAQDCVQLCTLE